MTTTGTKWEEALKAVTTGKLRVISREESRQVSRAVDALLSRRSEMVMEAPAALVLGELAVRVRCEPPYLLPHVRIRERGMVRKRIDPARSPHPRLSVEEQQEACKEYGVEWAGMASPSRESRDHWR